VAHEINNPLEAILNSLCMARDMEGVNGNFALPRPQRDAASNDRQRGG